MISPKNVIDINTAASATADKAMLQHSCESSNVVTLAMSQVVVPSSSSDIILAGNVETIGDVANEDKFLTETEFALLSHVTTVIGDYDPLSSTNIEQRYNFIPILEARGGIDKDEEGHRRDTIPIANGIDDLGTKTAVFQFLEENMGLSTHAILSNVALKKYLKRKYLHKIEIMTRLRLSKRID